MWPFSKMIKKGFGGWWSFVCCWMGVLCWMRINEDSTGHTQIELLIHRITGPLAVCLPYKASSHYLHDHENRGLVNSSKLFCKKLVQFSFKTWWLYHRIGSVRWTYGWEDFCVCIFVGFWKEFYGDANLVMTDTVANRHNRWEVFMIF